MREPVEIQIDDLAILRALSRLNLTTGGHAREAMREIARYMKTSTQLRFDAQEDPEGAKWKVSVRAKTHGGQTLRDHGHLRNSFQPESDDTSASLTTNIPYAAAHQFGVKKTVKVRAHRRMSRRGDKRRGIVSVKSYEVRAHEMRMNLPKRAFMGFSQVDKEEILIVLKAYIRKAAKAARQGGE